MNVPNRLTLSRFVLTVAFLVAIFCEFPGNETVARDAMLGSGFQSHFGHPCVRLPLRFVLWHAAQQQRHTYILSGGKIRQ